MSFSVHIYILSYSDYVYVQNPSKKYICLKKLLGVLRGGVGWGLGTLFARQGDTLSALPDVPDVILGLLEDFIATFIAIMDTFSP